MYLTTPRSRMASYARVEPAVGIFVRLLYNLLSVQKIK